MTDEQEGTWSFSLTLEEGQRRGKYTLTKRDGTTVESTVDFSLKMISEDGARMVWETAGMSVTKRPKEL